MKFVWDNGEWVQGEKPKSKKLKELIKENVLYVVAGLMLIGVWWWFVGEQWLLGDIIIPHIR
ncbi:MAG TPA: hypothetical protein VJ824_13500 [Bacillota bacterium]|nr:hypothetical protein [Bacillota bacterium]